MATLVSACMVPHGSWAIAELAGQHRNKFERTRQSMETIGKNIAATKPDTIIVLTPHGIHIDGAMCIIASDRMRGVLEENSGRVEVNMQVDQELGYRIARASFSAGVPAVTAISNPAIGINGYAPMDWGALVPLWFIGAHYTPQPRIVSITPSRSLSYEQHITFGRVLAQAITETPGKRRIALIASADWAHAHSRTGPYGYHVAAARFDAEIVEMVKRNELAGMASFDDEYIEDAKPDGIWQALILHGVQQSIPLQVQFHTYEVPTYFGLLCAEYTPSLNGHK